MRTNSKRRDIYMAKVDPKVADILSTLKGQRCLG
jgi:hypothetical protein